MTQPPQQSTPDAQPLLRQSVAGFLAEVASAETPVPAGGSVAALTGAAAAGLLALVCDVLLRKRDDERLRTDQAQAQRLQTELAALVDEDAAAYTAYLAARRAHVADLGPAIDRTAATPLAIGQACAQVLALTSRVEAASAAALLGDVRAARHLAQGALRAVLDISAENVALYRRHPNPAAEARMLQELSTLRQQLP